MFKYAIAAAAISSVLAGGPAFASAKVKSEAGTVKGQQATANRPTRYCYIIPATTGTIIDRKVCRTLDQWRAEGVDPTKPQNN